MKTKIILPFLAIALMLSAFGQKSIIQSPITSIESNSNMQLDSGLVAYYPFNGNAYDESGNGANGQVTGATLTTDRFGNANAAYYFNGDTNYILCPSDSLPTTNRTVCLWFFAETVDLGTTLMGYGGSTCGYSFIIILNNHDPLIGLNKYETQGHCRANELGITWTNPPVGSWYFWVISIHGDTTRMYVNDSLIGWNTGFTNPTTVLGKNLLIGSGVNTNGIGSFPDPYGNTFKGKLDDIRIYNRALSESEIQQLYHEGSESNVEISGTITDPNGNPVNGGNVYFFNTSNLFSGYDTTDVTTITNGTFTNYCIPNSPSLLLAFPDSSHLSSMLPTYYGDTIYWMGADTILTSVNLDLGTIKFTPRPPSPSGNATISGRVVSNLYTKANDPIDNVGVILKKNSKGSFVDYTLSDANGLFSFNNVEVGNYSIFVDYPGIRMYTNNGANDVSVVNPDDSIQIIARVDSAFIRISGNIGIFSSSPKPYVIIIYPNPTSGLFTLAFENPGREKVTVSISSIDGRMIYSNEFITGNDNNFKKVIDLPNLMNGIYIVKIQTKQRAVVKSLIVN